MSKAQRLSFSQFYTEVFRDEHRHPANISLHIFGVIAGLCTLLAAFTIGPLWGALAAPLIHVVPGLIGHRLFERSEDFGDMRLTRKDFPLYWFLIANHLMAFDWARHRLTSDR
jgi:hypothetical protein